MARFDDLGMFWEDIRTDRSRANTVRPQPPIPETGWRAPQSFPNLSEAVVLSLDTETYDPELLKAGPGWARNKGHMVGFSVGAQDRHGNIGQWYFPIRHTICPEENLDAEMCLRWLKEQVSDNRPKVGANITYDIGWLQHEGVFVKGPLHDIQFAEALLDERATVSLDVCAAKYLNEHKQGSLLYQWCSDFYGGPANDRQRANIYRSPPSLVGPYGEGDASLPLRVITQQWDKLDKEGLVDLYRMECDLIPLMVAMRFAGVTVDIPRAEQFYEKLGGQVVDLTKTLSSQVGFNMSVNSGQDIARAFDKEGIPYPLTKDGNPSFRAEYLESVAELHPVAQTIVDIRQREKLRGTFIKSYILDSHVNGKVHGTFNLLRGEDNGTRSGRLSSQTPNLQNIPIRTDIGKEIRRIFTFDPGHKQWIKIDYSQIEYRMLAHFAVDDGDGSAERLRQTYINNPDIDYHQLIHDLILEITGIDLVRAHTKNMNFGLIYAMGEKTLARKLNLALKKSKELSDAYHNGAPFAKATLKATSKEANNYGLITTILGRRSRFDLWEPDSYDKKGIALPYSQALIKYGRIKRAYTHKSLNRKLQGSAADLMKKAMLECWQSGVFDYIGVPRLTVHDELDFSDPGGRDDGFLEMRRILENAIPLRIPVRADMEYGVNWGDVKALEKLVA